MSTTDSRSSTVVDAVPSGLFIGGEWRDGAGGDARRRGPVDRRDDRRGRRRDARRRHGRARRGRRGAGGVGGDGAARARRDPAPRLRADHRARRRPRAADDARDGQAAGRVQGRDHLRGGVLPLVLRGGGAHRRAASRSRRTAPGRAARRCASPSARATSSRRGTSRWRWARARSARPIAAGCTMVIKPAKQTPLSMLALAQILEEAGLPGGVLNVVTASSAGDVSEPIIADPRLRKLSFTGSTEVGRKLIEQSAENVLRVSMELGGNAPFLVFDDADLDAAVEGAMIAKMRNIGEACTAANRFHVARVASPTSSPTKLAEKLGAMKVGRGTEEGVEVGPLIDDDAARQGRRARRRRGRQGRAAVVGGGGASTARATSTSRRCSSDVPDDARLLKEEIFGPVAPVARSSTRTRRSPRPTTPSTAWSPTSTRATSSARSGSCERLETGMVGLNQGMVSNAGGAVRRRQAVRLRPRGRPRGHRGVPRDQVRRDGDCSARCAVASCRGPMMRRVASPCRRRSRCWSSRLAAVASRWPVRVATARARATEAPRRASRVLDGVDRPESVSRTPVVITGGAGPGAQRVAYGTAGHGTPTCTCSALGGSRSAARSASRSSPARCRERRRTRSARVRRRCGFADASSTDRPPASSTSSATDGAMVAGRAHRRGDGRAHSAMT